MKIEGGVGRTGFQGFQGWCVTGCYVVLYGWDYVIVSIPLYWLATYQISHAFIYQISQSVLRRLQESLNSNTALRFDWGSGA